MTYEEAELMATEMCSEAVREALAKVLPTGCARCDEHDVAVAKMNAATAVLEGTMRALKQACGKEAVSYAYASSVVRSLV